MSPPAGQYAGRRAGILVASCILALGTAAAGCGGDDEDNGSSDEPSTIEPATPTGPTGAAGEEGTEDGEKPEDVDGDVGLEDGTVTPPPESDSQAQGGEDSPENDIPPEPGSPEAKFEEFCDENPEACG